MKYNTINLTPVIAIDGPSGCGKGTLSRALAKALNWHMLDSGALYRTLAWQALNACVDLQDVDALVQLGNSLAVELYSEAQHGNNDIRTESCGTAASKIATLPEVRECLLQKQRDFRRDPGLVADGRDMGTVVFPDAIVKLYLTATPECRARRRFEQLQASNGRVTSIESILDGIMERDMRDATRASAPLKPDSNAIVLDTTGLSIRQVFDRAIESVGNIMG